MRKPQRSVGNQKFPAGAPVSNLENAPLWDFETGEQAHPHLPHDQFYLSDDDKKELGLEGCVHSCVADLVDPQTGDYVFPGDKVLLAVTPPAVADKLNAPQILHSKRHRRPSFVLHKLNGNTVPCTRFNDLVWATVDREEYLGTGERKLTSSQAFHQHKCDEFTRGLINGKISNDQLPGGETEIFDNTAVEREKRRAHAFMQAHGEKWGRNMTLIDIEKSQGAEYTRQIERKFARGGRTERPNEYAEYEDRMAEMSKKAKGNKSVSIPNSPTR